MKREWLLPMVSRLSRWAVRLYYRASFAGERPPETGPALFVANHPNSGLDPAFVAATAGRPVRFLAKAPLFQQRVIGRLLRACGAIPVYRRQDDPGLMDRNERMFAAVQRALAAGSAVGIFPEGITHSRPSMAPLRTGAARIALGAARLRGGAFPVIPVGILLRRKDRFRSEAVALAGVPVSWTDLEGRGAEDVDAVRQLTARVDRALRDVTLNLERWEDAPAVRFVGEVYAAEFRLPRGPADRIRRERRIADAMALLRREDPHRLRRIAQASVELAELLRAVGAGPADLDRRTRPRAAAGWALRQLVLLGIGAPLSVVGHLVFYLPYRLTDAIGTRPHLEEAVRATYKLLGGAVIYSAWVFLLAALTALAAGALPGVVLFVVLPALGLITLVIRERWRDDRARLQRFLRFTGQGDERGRLLMMRRELAEELEAARPVAGRRRERDGSQRDEGDGADSREA